MCLVHFHLQEHPTYKLIVAANRDEFYERPTSRAHYWPDAPFLLAGRDLLQQGTWLGVTKEGRFAALTNIRDLSMEGKDKKSRGHTVRGFLSSTASHEDFISEVRKERNSYAGFNLLFGDSNALYHYNNAEDNLNKITSGTHSLSNASLNTPWPKVRKGKEMLDRYIQSQKELDPNQIFKILENSEEAQDSILPKTGISLELERKLSASFIKTPDYGTRSATVLLIDRNHQVIFKERTYQNGALAHEEYFSFKLPLEAK